MSLIREVKRRVKSAGYADAGLRLASEVAEEGTEYALQRNIKDTPQPVSALSIRPIVESRISDFVTEMVKAEKIRPNEAKRVSDALMEQAKPLIRKQETEAYRREASERVWAPATITGTAGTAAMLTAFPWLLSRGSWLIGKRPEKPYSLGEAFRSNFVPAFVPISAGFEAVGHLISPMMDPQRKNKERGYWRSVHESFRGAQQGLAERGAEARERYGALGIPLQMFHGILNPLSSLAYLGRQVGGAFQRPDVKAWAQEAAERRRARLEQGL